MSTYHWGAESVPSTQLDFAVASWKPQTANPWKAPSAWKLACTPGNLQQALTQSACTHTLNLDQWLFCSIDENESTIIFTQVLLKTCPLGIYIHFGKPPVDFSPSPVHASTIVHESAIGDKQHRAPLSERSWKRYYMHIQCQRNMNSNTKRKVTN